MVQHFNISNGNPERRRHPKKKRKRNQSDSDSDSSESDFCEASSLFKASRVLDAASKHPGALLESGVNIVFRALASHQGGGRRSQSDTAKRLLLVVPQYLTTALLPATAFPTTRNEREWLAISPRHSTRTKKLTQPPSSSCWLWLKQSSFSGLYCMADNSS